MSRAELDDDQLIEKWRDDIQALHRSSLSIMDRLDNGFLDEADEGIELEEDVKVYKQQLLQLTQGASEAMRAILGKLPY